MDFRTCPACKASVLEDDVEDCPFCGASMSGKPGAAPKAKSAPGPAKPAKGPAAGVAEKPEKPAAKPAAGAPKGGPRRPFGETTADEDNPFDIDTTAVRKAIPVSPKPTKSRTYEIKCKMCDSVGYISPNDAGKDVKCYNPSCLTPVYKSPAIVKEKVEEKKKGLSVAMLLLIGLPLLGIIGGAVYFLVLKPKKPEIVEKDIVPVDTPVSDMTGLVARNVPVEEKKKLTPAELRKLAQKEIVVRAQGGDKLRPSSLKLQYAIEGLADTGDMKEASGLYSRLKLEAKTQSFFQVQPLVSMGLTQLAEGKQAEAEKSADAALKVVDRLPGNERQSLDAITSLAALLVQLGKTDSGVELIKKYGEAGTRGISSAIWMAAIEGRSFDLDLEAGRPCHLSMTSPTWVAVVETLAARGASEKALLLCQSAEIPNPDVRDCAYAAWASMLAVRGGLNPADLASRVDGVISEQMLGAVTQSRIWSSIAYHYAAMKQESDAQQALKKASEAISGVPALTPSAVPNMKTLYNSRGRFFAGLPDPAPFRSQAEAVSAISLVQGKMGNTEAAVTAFKEAMKAAQAIAPSLVQTQQLVDACDKNRSGLQAQLQSTLGLKNPTATELDRVFSAYRGQVFNLHDEAKKRFEFESDLIRSVTDMGIVEPVWTYLLTRIEATDPVEQQSFLKSDVPGYIAGRAIVLKDEKLTREIAALISAKGQPAHPLDVLLVEAEQLMAEGKLSAAADKLDAAYRKGDAKSYPFRLDQDVLRLMGRYRKSHHSVALTKEFLMGIRDFHLREDGFRILAAAAMKAGQGQPVWEMLQEQDVKHRMGDADEVATLRGLLERGAVQK